MRKGSESYLSELEIAKKQYGPGCAAKVERLLRAVGKCQFDDAESLIRFHDALLFLRAFPQSRNVAELAERLLNGIERRVDRLREAGADLDLFDSEEFSGIAGTVIEEDFTYEVTRWLAQRHRREITAEWDIDEQGRQMSSSLPQLVPLLGDDCLVEADTPYLRWLSDAAGGEDRILSWLLERIEKMPLSMLDKTAWYDALRINVAWDLHGSPVSRTRARRNSRQMYYHPDPLLQRKQVSLEQEFSSPSLPLRKLRRKEAESVLDMMREALTVRYRELWGTTRGDPDQVFDVELGRGVHVFACGLLQDRRLPLRAYHAGLTVKNGVPVNYFEAISLFEWVEVGFNTFYAFRDGETAWIYSKLLHLLHQLTGVTCFSVYPYQLGADNEEAIKSGAFWFYRKLGFRPGDPEALAITEREEKKIGAKPGYRTSARTLRKLAAEHAFYEIGNGPLGLWDRFSTRNIGYAVQRRMAAKFKGDAGKLRLAAVAELVQKLGVDPGQWNALQQSAFADFAVVLALAPELSRLTATEKQRLIEIIRAKVGSDEAKYLRLLQQHSALKEIFLRLGSAPSL
jgi:hypothetical protein